jgi:4-azaleucine resistance transporter AzlC
MDNKWKSFWKGCAASSPLLTGVIPFGIICGASCVDNGISIRGAMGMSVIIFAGASQLVVTQLMANDVSVWVVILTGVMINMRMLMYSASLSQHFRTLPVGKKLGLSYFLTDQAYATSIHHYDQQNPDLLNKTMFYLGAGFLMWFSFNVTTVIGAITGRIIPANWELDFAVPLTFIALLVPAIKNRYMLYATVIAASIALMMHGLPYSSGLLLGAVSGIIIGYVLERKARG